MATETTATTVTAPFVSRWERVPLSEQRVALAALDRIIELHPNLPAAHITLSYTRPEQITVQAQKWHHLEAWRIALNVSPAEVELGCCEPERDHIEFEAQVDEGRVRVYVLGDERPAVADDSAVSA
ncbi:hypothetical protein OG746_26960 [Streptomyces sp. NBC_01016]|uniref:hypothetical protein n=1 Tax=Streptomyces sp. NBC_01016 TaxID=2903720 RepID=UPI0022563111|nr:hypothetical protein [Streptomyces sp. NBC_01016]MCX4827128.1 hypothetical protein [Streptomyces sp. NBC_01016]MCX4832383.1 hypothetical protein [Streptomyces sp. NBC_01016]